MSFEDDLPRNMRIDDHLEGDFDGLVRRVGLSASMHPEGDILDVDVEFTDPGLCRDFYNGAGLIVHTLIDRDAAPETYKAVYRAMMFAYQTMLELPYAAVTRPDIVAHVSRVVNDPAIVNPANYLREEVLDYLVDNPSVDELIGEFSVRIHDSPYEASAIELAAGMTFMVHERAIGERHTRESVQAIVGDSTA
jgi:hypothetical protein